MRRLVCVVVLTLIAPVLAGGDAFACGDKFLRLGRSPHTRPYASVHPASILVYAPGWKRRGVVSFEKLLRRAGHTPATVTTAGALALAFTGGRYDLVITAYADSPAVTNSLATLAAKPAILPLLYQPKKAEAAAARAAYRCLLEPERMDEFQALEQIDRLLDLHLKGLATLRTGS